MKNFPGRFCWLLAGCLRDKHQHLCGIHDVSFSLMLCQSCRAIFIRCNRCCYRCAHLHHAVSVIVQWGALADREWRSGTEQHCRLNLCYACIFACTFIHDMHHCMLIIMSSAHGVPLIVAMEWGAILVRMCVVCEPPYLQATILHGAEETSPWRLVHAAHHEVRPVM